MYLDSAGDSVRDKRKSVRGIWRRGSFDCPVFWRGFGKIGRTSGVGFHGDFCVCYHDCLVLFGKADVRGCYGTDFGVDFFV